MFLVMAMCIYVLDSFMYPKHWFFLFWKGRNYLLYCLYLIYNFQLWKNHCSKSWWCTLLIKPRVLSCIAGLNPHMNKKWNFYYSNKQKKKIPIMRYNLMPNSSCIVTMIGKRNFSSYNYLIFFMNFLNFQLCWIIFDHLIVGAIILVVSWFTLLRYSVYFFFYAGDEMTRVFWKSIKDKVTVSCFISQEEKQNSVCLYFAGC